ncbi:MAG: YHS domain-containing (seleno)protein [Rhodothalassiaceae bacterium]
MHRLFSILAVALVGLGLASAPALAAKPEIYVKEGGIFSSGWDYALNGYDPVAYFTEGKPVQGDDAHVYEYKGAKFRFASEEHLEQFKADPDKYRPQFGGYCAYAVAKGQTAAGDPEVWAIEEGKLYLNLNKGIQKKWFEDVPGHIDQANANWPKVLN